MLRPTLLIFLACAVSLSCCATILENGAPILWAQTMDLTELPKEGEIISPNPFNYLHRMSLGRVMISSTNPFMASMGPKDTESPLWANTLQLGWLLTSGRFADPTDGSTCGKPTGDTLCISPESWWGCVNYFISVIPFLSAAQQGFLGEGAQVKMQVPEGVTGFCSTHAECSALYPDVMAKWDAFFQSLTLAYSTLSESEKRDSILGAFWEAQMASIQASSSCDAKKSHYSTTEVAFADSWLNLFDYLAAVYFQSNLEISAKFMAPLPSRILLEDDKPGKIADLSGEENHSVYIFSWVHSINSLMGETVKNAWKRAMCTAELREKGRDMMQQLVLNPGFPTGTFVMMVTGMAASC